MFALSALVLLGATLWLLAQDHDHPWKRYQLEYRAINNWTTAAELRQQEIDGAAAPGPGGSWQRIGDRIARAPILDAFNPTEIGIDQIWLPDLTIDYHFTDVARFDRCITCHRGIDRTRTGSTTAPRYPTIAESVRLRSVSISLPSRRPVRPATAPGAEGNPDAIANRFLHEA